MNAILAIDGGGTRTRAGLYDEQGTLLAEAEGDATNLVRNPAMFTVEIIADLGRTLVAKSPSHITKVLAGISGAGRTGQAQDVANGLAQALGTTDVAVCSDAHMMSWANLDAEHPILIIAGTGSVVITRRSNGSRVVTGGYGPILGDEGGAYRLALQGIRVADENEELRDALVSAAGCTSYPQLFHRITYEKPAEIAALASVVTREADAGNPAARAALRDQAEKLAALARHGLARAGIELDSLQILKILIAGGLAESELYLDELVTALVPEECVGIVERPRFSGHRAAFEMRNLPVDASFVRRPNGDRVVLSKGTTEDIDEHWGHLDGKAADQIAYAMSFSEVLTHVSVKNAMQSIGLTIETAAACLRAGGRIIYAGAGTSGRLGVLDASECPPTFGVDEGRVIGLIAGGDAALRHSIEGAEDDTVAAARDVDAISPRVGANDIVIGITASGATPYALAAIDRGKALGAKTALVSCNPAPLDRADIVIALDTGPEVLPGSTRLKAGTATKLVLNQISTGAMAKAGYVFEGRMVGVRPMNKKLRQRCIRIIAELTKEDPARAEQRLDETGGSVRLAVLMARRSLPLDEARRRLDACQGVLRDALELR